jgi:hypothetical protein
MARVSKSSARITYLPEDPDDPRSVRWWGHVFHANAPKTVTHSGLIEKAKANRFFKVDDSDRSKDGVKSADATAPKMTKQSRARTVPRLLLSEVDEIADNVSNRLGKRTLTENRKRQLLHSINETLAQYAFYVNAEKERTPKQFKKDFDELRKHLKSLKSNLPRSDVVLFDTICRHGEAYAERHGPHPGLEPARLPPLSLPDLEPELKFHSPRRLREMIEAVDQVEEWMNSYNIDLVPKIGWRRLTAIPGRQARLARVQLIGHALPKLYRKYFGRLPRSASSPGTDKRTYRPWVDFVCEVYRIAGLGGGSSALAQSTVEQSWKRMQKIPLKMALDVDVFWKNKNKRPKWLDEPE